MNKRVLLIIFIQSSYCQDIKLYDYQDIVTIGQDCVNDQNPIVCCQNLKNTTNLQQSACINNALSKMTVTEKKTYYFQHYTTFTSLLNSQLNNMRNMQTEYCKSLNAQSIEQSQSKSCSPKGWFEYFNQHFFKTPFFISCPGMFYYLLNAYMNDPIGTLNTAQLQSDITQTFNDVQNSGNTIPDRAAQNKYYDFFIENYPNDFFNLVVLPFIQIAQQSDAIVNSANLISNFANFLGGGAPLNNLKVYYAGLYNIKSGYQFDVLNSKLQQQLSSGLNLCQPYNDTFKYGDNKLSSTSQFLNRIVLSKTVTDQLKTNNVWPQKCATNDINICKSLYKYYQYCCPSGQEIGSGKAYMCRMVTAMYDMLSALINLNTAQFAMLQGGTINEQIDNLVTPQDKLAIQNCIKSSLNSATSSCIASGSCNSAQDLDQKCIKCVSDKSRESCKTQINNASKAVSSGSPIYIHIQAIANAMTELTEARVKFANVVKSEALNSKNLPDMSDAVTKCYAFCDQENKITYQDIPDWNKFAQAYNKEFSFITGVNHLIYSKGSCPETITNGSRILLEAFSTIMEVIGLAFSATDIFYMAMWIAMEGISTQEGVIQDQQTFMISKIIMQQLEDSAQTLGGG